MKEAYEDQNGCGAVVEAGSLDIFLSYLYLISHFTVPGKYEAGSGPGVG